MQAKTPSKQAGSANVGTLFVWLVMGAVALSTAPLLGEGFDKSIEDKVGAEQTPAPVGGSDGAGGASEAELDGAAITLSATAYGSIAEVDFGQYGDAPAYEGSSFPWKGVAIVGAAIVVTAVLIATAPISIPAAIALGGVTLIVASSAIELGECVFGDDACSDALIAPRAAFDTLSYPFLHPKETVEALATIGNNVVVQPIVQCTGIGSGSCGDALDTARDTGGQIVTGLKDAALTAGNCASTGDAASCGQTGAEIFAAFGIPAGTSLARSRFATRVADNHPRLASAVAPRNVTPDGQAGALPPGRTADTNGHAGDAPASSTPSTTTPSTTGTESYVSFVDENSGIRVPAHVVDANGDATVVQLGDGSTRTLTDVERASTRVSRTSRDLFTPTVTPHNPLGIDQSYRGIGDYRYLGQDPNRPLSQEYINPGGGCSVASGTNCQRVALVADQTLNGYAPARAGERVLNPDGTPNNIDGLYDAEIFHRASGSQVDEIVLDPNNPRSLEAQVDEVVEGWGDGAKGLIVYDWADGGRHINNVVNVDGNVRYADFQTPDTLDPVVRTQQFPQATRVRVVRTQNVPWIDRNTFDGFVRASSTPNAHTINVADGAAYTRANARLDELVGPQPLAVRSALADRLARATADEGTDLIRRVRENGITLSAQDLHAQHIRNLAVPPPAGVVLAPGEVVLRSNRGLFAERAQAAGGEVVQVIDGQHAVVRVPPASTPITQSDAVVSDLIARSGLSTRTVDGNIEIHGSSTELQQIAAQLPASVDVSIHGDTLTLRPMDRADYQPHNWGGQVDQDQVIRRRQQRHNLGLGDSIIN